MKKQMLVKTIVWLSLFLIISWILTFAFKNQLSELAFHTLFLLEGIFTLFLLPAAIYTVIGVNLFHSKPDTVDKIGTPENNDEA